MRMPSSAVLMFVVLALAACAPAPEEVVVEEPDTTEADVAAVQALVEAWRAGNELPDWEPFLALFSDDAQIYANWGPVVDGKDAIRSFVTETFFQGPMTISSNEREVMGAVAYELGTFVLGPILQEGEQPRTIYGKYLLIMRRQADGSWKLTRFMWNNTPPPEE